jgi:hypothetical protein
MIEEDPLHPDFVTLQPGDWVQTLTPTSLKTGQVLKRKGRSLLVLYQAQDKPTAHPDAEAYFSNPVPGEWGMIKVEPQHRLSAPTSHTMTVRQAAAKLGTDTKTIRRKLRSGELRGKQKEGKWIAVFTDE